jgi:hypothetical protein
MRKAQKLIVAIALIGLFVIVANFIVRIPIFGARVNPVKTGVRQLVNASSGYTFMTLAIPDAVASSAEGISSESNGGTVVGTYSDADGNTHGFTYSLEKGEFQTLDFPGGSATYLNGVDDDDRYVGYYSPTPTAHRESFLYSGSGFTLMTFPGAVESFAFANTFDPHDPETPIIVGSYSDKTGADHGFMGAINDFETLDYPNAVSTELRGIYFSDAFGPQIVGYFTNPSSEGSFLYDDLTEFSSIAVPGAAQTYASGINGGYIVGGYSDSSSGQPLHGFVSFYGAGGERNYVTVDYPGADQTFVSATTSFGDLVGSYGPSVTDTNAFIAFPNAFGTVAPLSLDFGGEPVGSKNQLTVTLTNTGASTIDQLQKITAKVEGTNPNDFTVSNHCASESLDKNQSCTIAVTFDPLATGGRSASLVVSEVVEPENEPALNSPQVVQLAGVGTSSGTPGAEVSPASLNFATLLVGKSVSKPVTLTNTGTAPLLISNITLLGNYSQTNNCGKSVAAGDSCTITVKFAPTSAGTFGGVLSIYDDVSGGRQVVSLTGAATVVSLTPNPLEFGSTDVGSTSAAQDITVKNTGKTSLKIGGKSVTGDFLIASGGTCGATLAAGASCRYSIEFKPTKTGTRTGTFSLTDNGGGSPQKVSLTGTGT